MGTVLYCTYMTGGGRSLTDSHPTTTLVVLLVLFFFLGPRTTEHVSIVMYRASSDTARER